MFSGGGEMDGALGTNGLKGKYLKSFLFKDLNLKNYSHIRKTLHVYTRQIGPNPYSVSHKMMKSCQLLCAKNEVFHQGFISSANLK